MSASPPAYRRRHDFNGRGYATYDNAERVLVRYGDLYLGCSSLIAAGRNGRFYPVVILSPTVSVPIRALAERGICIVN